MAKLFNCYKHICIMIVLIFLCFFLPISLYLELLQSVFLKEFQALFCSCPPGRAVLSQFLPFVNWNVVGLEGRLQCVLVPLPLSVYVTFARCNRTAVWPVYLYSCGDTCPEQQSCARLSKASIPCSLAPRSISSLSTWSFQLTCRIFLRQRKCNRSSFLI